MSGLTTWHFFKVQIVLSLLFLNNPVIRHLFGVIDSEYLSIPAERRMKPLFVFSVPSIPFPTKQIYLLDEEQLHGVTENMRLRLND